MPLLLLCALTGLLLTRRIAPPRQAVTAAPEQVAEKNLASLAGELDGMIRLFRLEGAGQSGGWLSGKATLALERNLRVAHS